MRKARRLPFISSAAARRRLAGVVLAGLSVPVPLLAAVPGDGHGGITLDLDCHCEAAQRHCEVVIAHRGTEPAQELMITVAAGGRPLAVDSPGRLAPGEEWRQGFDLRAAGPPGGPLALALRARAVDSQGHPYSAVGWGLLPATGPRRAPDFEAELTVPHQDDSGADLRLVLRDLTGRRGDSPGAGGGRELAVRLELPGAYLDPRPSPLHLHLPAGQTRELRWRIENRQARPGSRHAIHAVVATIDGSRPELQVAVAVLAAPELLPPLARGYLRLPVATLAALLLLAAALPVRRRPSGAVTPSRRESGATPRAAPCRQLALELAVLGLTTGYLLLLLRPDLLLSSTTATGGDTASHVLTAEFLRRELLPQGRILGWMPGNLAGYPLFQPYFPLPFLAVAALAPLLGAAAAFKLVSLAGVLGLPAAAWGAARLARWPHPAPALAAACALPFLLQEGYAVWGGNLLSTLAGEFAYGWGLCLLLLFVGSLARAGETRWGWVGRAVLLAAIGLCHAYTLLLAVAAASLAWLWGPQRRRRLPDLAATGLLAGGLLAFWLLPLLLYAPWTSPYRDLWDLASWRELLPAGLLPVAGIAAAGLLWQWTAGRRTATAGPLSALRPLACLLLAAGVLYGLAPLFGAVDVRFLPAAHLALALLAAPPLAALVRRLAAAGSGPRRTVATAAATLALTLAALLGGDRLVENAPRWVAWNLSGFEARPLWPAFSKVQELLRGGPDDGRVAFEHSPLHDAAGSIRAFESLPLFAGRSTLEGPYIQSAISAPQIFYLQSEYSRVASCPFPDRLCAGFDLNRAAEHLRLYDVEHFVARSPEVKAALAAAPDFVLTARIPPYEIHRLTGERAGLAEPLAWQPLLLEGGAWKETFFRWFRRPGTSSLPLVHVGRGASPPGRFPLRVGAGLAEFGAPIPRRPLPGATEVRVEAHWRDGGIDLRTNRPGHPVLVRVSYHPRWRAAGADGPYLASPGFLLVYPREPVVRLEFGDPPAVRAAQVLTGLSVVFVLGVAVAGRRRRRDPATPPPSGTPAPSRRGAAALTLLLLLAGLGVGLAARRADPGRHLEAGLAARHSGNVARARHHFDWILRQRPLAAAAIHAAFYRALLAWDGGDFERAATDFRALLTMQPDSPYRDEARFHLALALERSGRPAAAHTELRRLAAAPLASPWRDRARQHRGLAAP